MDLKGVGYLISTVSVLLLGWAAWPKPDEPAWKAVAILAGMSASVLGMLIRYLAHRKEKVGLSGR